VTPPRKRKKKGAMERKREEGGDEPGGYVSQMIDDSAWRLERLESKLHDIKESIEHGDDGVDYVHDMEARLDALNDDGCSDNEFSCGGSNRMCVLSMLACDGTEDCPNGEDESESRCKNKAKAGRKFTGHIHWDGCKAKKDSEMTINILTNKIYNYFPSRVLLSARTTFDYGTEAHSFDSEGYYDFGKKSFSLHADDGHVNADCHFITADVTDCTITNTAGDTCAVVRLHDDH